ncbi:uncharacterized protein [Typha latifolia]|uniref:uncharacterized protein n=1 Tax=Typha latifolia TaxID=4733 RepID=UPI003C2C7C6C
MYTRRLKCRCQNLYFLLVQSGCTSRPSSRSVFHIDKPLKDGVFRSSSHDIGNYRRYAACYPNSSCRFYCSKGDGANPSEGKHVPAKDTANFGIGKTTKEEAVIGVRYSDEHARLGEQDQQDWLNSERLYTDNKKRESPFLTKREMFKNEFLRRVVPWEKIMPSWDSFPYYVNEHTKHLLVECAASHLKHKKFTSSYGSRLVSSGGRILLQSMPGTELYRERLVRALARDLQVPILVLDSSVLAPYDYGEECSSECESDEENAGSDEECTSESEIEDENDANNEEWTSSNEAKSSESDDDAVQASAQALKKLVPCSLEEFAQRVAGEAESTSTSEKSETVVSTEESKRPLKKGDRVKYIGTSVHVEVDHRIILGKIPTSDGSTNAFTSISGRPLSKGQRGEVYEINGEQVAVIFDNLENKVEEGRGDEKIKEEKAKPSIYWIDIQDIVHDFDTEVEDWYIAMEALCEVLPSLQPVIVYFPDSSEWLSRAAPKSNMKEFICKVDKMFDQLPGPVLLISGQNIVATGAKEKEKITMVLPHLGRVARLPLPLKQLTEGLRKAKSSKANDIHKLFRNTLSIQLPKEEEQLRIFNKQIEDDQQIIISRSNLIELQKVLEENELSCMELIQVNSDSIILTRQKAEKVVGWARNHYLSAVNCPSIKGNKLMIPRESLDIAIARLREQEITSRRSAQSLKSLAKDEFESNFISAVVPSEEIGVKFDDIGALEDVKKTLEELVTLPMRRPELFSHGNLLRPCKGILLFGPPGTGKTLLAKALATEAGANFISITGSTLTSKWFGDAEKLTKALFSFASRLAPVVIFVDEVDSLLGARGGAFEHEATRRMRNEFMAAWDGLRSKDSQRILILAATNRPFDLDDAVIRRLPRRIYVDLPDAENRVKILRIFLSQENLEPDFRYDELANATEGYSGSDLKNLCIAAAYRPVQELLEGEKGGVTSSQPSLRSLRLDDFIQAKAKVGASVAYDATSMNELRKWNEQYGEGGSRRQSPFGFGN